MIQTLFIVGLALITIGIGFIYWPAALIFAGVVMSTIAFQITLANQLTAQTKPASEAN